MITLAMLMKDPPLDRLAMLLDYVAPVVGQVVVVVDDRTSEDDRQAVSRLIGFAGSQLVPFTWVDDFAAARNAALPYATGDWILHLDPDELPSAAMLAFLSAVDASEWGDVIWQAAVYPAPRGYLFFTRNYFDGRKGEEYEEHWHCRLFRRDRGRWYKPVHEQVELEGRPEPITRGMPWLPKAPRAAYLIHSRMNDARIDEQYVALGERGQSGAPA
jgi:glycosyltransferase involved in cell wall biosynthesis